MYKYLQKEGIDPNVEFQIPDKATQKEIKKYGLDKYAGIEYYNLRDDENFTKDIRNAQFKQWKKLYKRRS
jgi:hypothetical protein